MVKSIYPSIPMPGMQMSTLQPTVEALRQTVNLIILNGLSPNPNYTPSESAQVFVTYAAIKDLGIVGPRGPEGPQGPPGASGVPEAPNDANVYGRHALGWQSISLQAAATSPANVLTTSSGSYVMQGLSLSIQLNVATRWKLSWSGTIGNTNGGGETDVQLFYGTGNAPANGAPPTGTPVGSTIRLVGGPPGMNVPFSKSVLLQGTIPGTTYWFDLAMLSNGGGVASLRDLDFMINGLW